MACGGISCRRSASRGAIGAIGLIGLIGLIGVIGVIDTMGSGTARRGGGFRKIGITTRGGGGRCPAWGPGAGATNQPLWAGA